jgi:hypothetical protein
MEPYKSCVVSRFWRAMQCANTKRGCRGRSGNCSKPITTGIIDEPLPDRWVELIRELNDRERVADNAESGAAQDKISADQLAPARTASLTLRGPGTDFPPFTSQ